jgi:hypothetical protein
MTYGKEQYYDFMRHVFNAPFDTEQPSGISSLEEIVDILIDKELYSPEEAIDILTEEIANMVEATAYLLTIDEGDERTHNKIWKYLQEYIFYLSFRRVELIERKQKEEEK